MGGIDLGHNLAKEEQKESKENGETNELQPIGTSEVDDMCEEIVAEHDNSHIHQVVGDENSGEGAL